MISDFGDEISFSVNASDIDISSDDPLLKPLRGSQFITITLKPKLYKYSSVTQFELTKHDIGMAICASSSDFCMIPEHTAVGNIHYHAWFKPSNDLSTITLMNKLKKMRNVGFIKLTPEKIESNDSITRSYNYMNKDLDKTIKLFKQARCASSCIITKNNY